MAPKKSGGKKGGDEGEADRVHVVVRIRPPVRKDERVGELSESLQVDKEKNMLFLLAKDEEGKSNPKQYAFDRVLWKDSTQKDGWEGAGLSVTKSAMQGYTGCVMCYGQTGAGKTFTLANESKGNEGIMIQSFNHIFQVAAESRDLKYEVEISYQQIYLDSITDLLQPDSAVELREDPKEGVYVSGARWDRVTSTEEAIATLQRGNSNRAVACTKMNAGSSRSHAVLIMRIKCTGGIRSLNGMLYLVDLAGSERVKKSGVEGAAFDEAKAINQSLTTLGRCIEVLASGKKEKPPFRESKLTRLLSNAIGGAAKTTLVVCVAPTMIDQSETVGSLDFGQQAMNVVVRAKVNASTDYASLTASLLSQRDIKQKPIRELEAKVLRDLKPRLDEVVGLEEQVKRAALTVEVAEELVDAQKDRVAKAKAQGEAEAEADAKTQVELLNARAAATADLEDVLVKLSSNPEMKRLQEEHEQEKGDIMKRSMLLQEELRTAEGQERHERVKVEARLEGVVHTARNLGQIAVFFLQTGLLAEAADFYAHAKSLFEEILGPEHPKTVAWQEDLFFLINAPAIQKMAADVQAELKERMTPEERAAIERQQGDESAPSMRTDDDDDGTMGMWWMRNLFEMNAPRDKGADGADADGDDDVHTSWWMQNLFGMGARTEKAEPDQDADYMQIIFGTPRNDGTTTARGGPAFTPRGTLVALSQARGNAGAVVSLGLPLQKQSGVPEEQAPSEQPINMAFAKDWVTQVFETPRKAGPEGAAKNGEIEESMAEAVAWLQQNFGVTPRGNGSGAAAPAAALALPQFTPRGSRVNARNESVVDDAVMHAAMQAALSTPRVGGPRPGVDDTPMAGAMNKMFKNTFV